MTNHKAPPEELCQYVITDISIKETTDHYTWQCRHFHKLVWISELIKSLQILQHFTWSDLAL